MTFTASRPVCPAKLTRPQPMRALARTRLHEQLDQALAHPVTWLAGPPGAGKTTLVSSYLEAHQRPGIWYDTDAGDDDPATFFHYMDIAARHAAPRFRRPLPAFTPEHRPGLAGFARRYFEALYARLKTPAVLVLDNFQEAASDGPFQLIVAAAAAALPPGVRLVVLSRHEPPPAFARLRANNLLTVVDDAALRFTLDESCAMAALRGNTRAAQLDRPALERLHLAASGWAAGLVLLLERTTPGAGAPARNEHQVLFDYFAAEIFFAFDATTQQVLCQTALLPQASAALAQQLTGEPSAGRILADLYERNYFVLKQGHGAVYQFHPLFQAFLRHRAEAAWPTAQLNAVRTHAAQLLEANGDPEGAAELWRSAADWPALARQALKHAPVLAAQARFQPLEGWLRALPPAAFDGAPWLTFWLGVCRMQFNPMEAQAHFEQAFAGFEHTGDAAGLYMAWASVVECIYMAWRDLAPLGRWLDTLQALRRRHPQWPSPQIAHRVTGAAVAGYLACRPDQAGLRQWITQARAALDVMTDDMPRIQLAAHVVNAMNLLGQCREAATVVASLQLAGQAISGLPMTQAFWDSSTLPWHSPSPQHALVRFEAALASAQSGGVLPMVGPMLYGNASQAALMAGELPSARAHLQAASALLPPGSPFVTSYFWYVSALVSLHDGHAAQAAEQASRSLALLGDALPLARALSHITLFWALHAQGQLGAAQQHLDQAQAMAQASGSVLLAYWCALCRAHSALAAGDEAAAQTALRQAMGLSRDGHFFNFFWPRPLLARLCAQALTWQIDTPHVSEMISRLALSPADVGHAPEAWPWPVKLRTLGRLVITLGGQPLGFSGKVPKKPLALLMALISFGGVQVSEHRLNAALWHGAEAEDAHTAFTAALHRLRKLLGSDDALLLTDNRLSLNPDKVWLDVWALDRALSNTTGTAAQVLALYQGAFLDDNEAPWALAAREKLRAKFVRFATQQSQLCLAQGQHHDAMALLDQGIDAEPLAETLYRSRMRCQDALGQRAEALSTYRRCRQMLATVLGIEPAAPTRALYDALMADQPLAPSLTS